MLVENEQEVLAHKFVPPRLSSSLIPRPRLWECLNEGITRKLTLLSAPAGFGKTTILIEWLHHRRNATAIQPHCVWLSLDEGDNDPHRFWRHLIMACQTLNPSIGKKSLALLQLFNHPSFEVILIPLLNDFAILADEGVLVLDDYHVITTPAIHTAMVFLLEYLPTNMRFILSTRFDPPFPLERYRATHEFNEIRDTQLRFSKQELSSYLSQMMHRQFLMQELEKLEILTEGWIAGAQLIVLATKEHANFEPVLSSFTGCYPSIMNYLVKEVLSQQEEHIQLFLFETSFLHSFTSSLCDAITGRSDSALILTQVEQANLFLVPLHHQWFRYHTLFAETMQELARIRFNQRHISALYQRAVDWYEQHDFVNESIAMALASHAYNDAARLIAKMMDHVDNSWKIPQEFRTWLLWIEALPPEALALYPGVYLIYAVSLIFTGRPDEALLQLQKAENLDDKDKTYKILGAVYALRALLAQVWNSQPDQGIVFAKQALALLSEHDLLWRGVSLYVLAIEYRQTGKVRSAWELLNEGRNLGQMVRQIDIEHDCIIHMGYILFLQGKLQQSMLMYQECINQKVQNTVYALKTLIGLGDLYFQWNDLKMALQCLSFLYKLDMHDPSNRPVLYGFLSLARVVRAQGDSQQAHEIIAQVITLTRNHHQSTTLAYALAYQAQVALIEGNVDGTTQWSRHSGLDLDMAPVFAYEREYLVFMRILIMQGQLGLALKKLQQWLKQAQSQGRFGSVIEILLLCALAYYKQRKNGSALLTLRKALLLSHAEGYIRIFIEEGEAMAALLHIMLGKEDEPDRVKYIQKLLEAFYLEQNLHNTTLLSSIDTLTRREFHILHLLAQGLSNREISQKELISLNTVKTHRRNLYRKLQAKTQHDAVKNARSLQLI